MCQLQYVTEYYVHLNKLFENKLKRLNDCETQGSSQCLAGQGPITGLIKLNKRKPTLKLN